MVSRLRCKPHHRKMIVGLGASVTALTRMAPTGACWALAAVVTANRWLMQSAPAPARATHAQLGVSAFDQQFKLTAAT